MGKHENLQGGDGPDRRSRSLRSRGLRAKRILVADTNADGFWSEIDRQCRMISELARSTDDLDFAQAAQHWPAVDPY